MLQQLTWDASLAMRPRRLAALVAQIVQRMVERKRRAVPWYDHSGASLGM